MAKIIALDIGSKRTGVAETDFLQIIASPKETVPTDKLMDYLKQLKEEEDFEEIVIGDPFNLDGGNSHNSEKVKQIVVLLQKNFAGIPITLEDEHFSSKMAIESMVMSGMKKKKRRQKGKVDQISAAIILQSYLRSR